MGKWRYILQEAGENLREVINGGNAATEEQAEKVIQAIKDCRDSLQILNPQASDFWAVEAMDELTQEHYADIREYCIESEDEFEEHLNGILQAFYDICDEAKIWIGV